MRPFLGNVLMALLWAAITGVFTLRNLAVGFALAYGILGLLSRFAHIRGYARRAAAAGRLVRLFLEDLVASNVRVAADVITPRFHMRPAIIDVPLDASSDAEILVLVSLIMLTPGNLVVHISDDRRVLYVHAMYVDDVDAMRRRIKDTFERALLEVTR